MYSDTFLTVSYLSLPTIFFAAGNAFAAIPPTAIIFLALYDLAMSTLTSKLFGFFQCRICRLHFHKRLTHLQIFSRQHSYLNI